MKFYKLPSFYITFILTSISQTKQTWNCCHTAEANKIFTWENACWPKPSLETATAAAAVITEATEAAAS